MTCQLSISLDGYVAGPDQGPEHPLGRGGPRLHEWAIATASWRAQHGLAGGDEGPDSDVAAAAMDGVGAFVMGRGMFAGPGPIDPEWRGWWGEDPPYHAPVFVVTHQAREPLAMQGGTTFSFVPDGVPAAVALAREAAGEADVAIAGGADVVRQALRAGLLDELHLHVAPVVLGAGERLFEDVGDATFEPVEVVASPRATHVRYRVGRSG